MSKDKQPHFFDQMIEAFQGYSPGGRVRATDEGFVFEITRAAAQRTGVDDPDQIVADLNAKPLSGGITKVAIVDHDTW